MAWPPSVSSAQLLCVEMSTSVSLCDDRSSACVAVFVDLLVCESVDDASLAFAGCVDACWSEQPRSENASAAVTLAVPMMRLSMMSPIWFAFPMAHTLPTQAENA